MPYFVVCSSPLGEDKLLERVDVPAGGGSAPRGSRRAGAVSAAGCCRSRHGAGGRREKARAARIHVCMRRQRKARQGRACPQPTLPAVACERLLDDLRELLDLDGAVLDHPRGGHHCNGTHHTQ